jgi:hypothetical protein
VPSAMSAASWRHWGPLPPIAYRPASPLARRRSAGSLLGVARSSGHTPLLAATPSRDGLHDDPDGPIGVALHYLGGATDELVNRLAKRSDVAHERLGDQRLGERLDLGVEDGLEPTPSLLALRAKLRRLVRLTWCGPRAPESRAPSNRPRLPSTATSCTASPPAKRRSIRLPWQPSPRTSRRLRSGTPFATRPVRRAARRNLRAAVRGRRRFARCPGWEQAHGADAQKRVRRFPQYAGGARLIAHERWAARRRMTPRSSDCSRRRNRGRSCVRRDSIARRGSRRVYGLRAGGPSARRVGHSDRRKSRHSRSERRAVVSRTRSSSRPVRATPSHLGRLLRRACA